MKPRLCAILTPEQRQRIVQLFDYGYSRAEIVEETGISRVSISRWINRHKKEGHVNNLPRSGRPGAMRSQEINEMLEKYKDDPGCPTKVLADNFGVSPMTIRRRLREHKARLKNRVNKSSSNSNNGKNSEENENTEGTDGRYEMMQKYISSKMMQLDEQQRFFVEKLIHRAIYEGEMANLNQNSNIIVNTEQCPSGTSDNCSNSPDIKVNQNEFGELKTSQITFREVLVKQEVDTEEKSHVPENVPIKSEVLTEGEKNRFEELKTSQITFEEVLVKQEVDTEESHIPENVPIKLEVLTEEGTNIFEESKTSQPPFGGVLVKQEAETEEKSHRPKDVSIKFEVLTEEETNIFEESNTSQPPFGGVVVKQEAETEVKSHRPKDVSIKFEVLTEEGTNIFEESKTSQPPFGGVLVKQEAETEVKSHRPKDVSIKFEVLTEEVTNIFEESKTSQLPFEGVLVKQEVKTEEDNLYGDLRTEFVMNKQRSSIEVYRSSDTKRRKVDGAGEAKIYLQLQDPSLR